MSSRALLALVGFASFAAPASTHAQGAVPASAAGPTDDAFRSIVVATAKAATGVVASWGTGLIGGRERRFAIIHRTDDRQTGPAGFLVETASGFVTEAVFWGNGFTQWENLSTSTPEWVVGMKGLAPESNQETTRYRQEGFVFRTAWAHGSDAVVDFTLRDDTFVVRAASYFDHENEGGGRYSSTTKDKTYARKNECGPRCPALARWKWEGVETRVLAPTNDPLKLALELRRTPSEPETRSE